MAGVTHVEVDLATELLTVDSDAPVDSAKIVTAVEEVGYEAASPRTPRSSWAPTASS
ncbi:heavy-metal-associated domain-containing protein [Nonomuraea sp. KM90]|uniref:heavy-metal-associated domain-containing protein n=1 Tax=Nonomuraea sp. KM90 TaxID=3457428 RepID=UPI003FCD8F1F